jgi:16S rRNA G1207 methylase RsmC
LNYNEGDTLRLDIKDKWGIDGFDAVIGNPPYSLSGNTGNSIWQCFTKHSLNKWLANSGYLIFVHPPTWRKPCYDKSKMKGLFKLLTYDNYMIHLSIHGIKDGRKTFKCGTKYDWYVIKKNTIVMKEHV